MKYLFFPSQAMAKFRGVLNFILTGFDLVNSFTRWKRPNFKIRYTTNSQNSVKKANSFLGKL